MYMHDLDVALPYRPGHAHIQNTWVQDTLLLQCVTEMPYYEIPCMLIQHLKRAQHVVDA